MVPRPRTATTVPIFGQIAGRIAHMRQWNPARGAKLQSLFDQIRWSD